MSPGRWASAEERRELARLGRDPVLFSKAFLRHDPWHLQREILRSVAREPRTAVKACHASAKTHVAADAVVWWTTRYSEDGLVITTAPTWTQVERLLWGEIHRSTSQARLGGLPKLNKTELPFGPENYAIGLSTNEGVRFQGWHGRILIVLDEAPGVLPEIWEAIEGIRAGGDVHVLALGNPIVASGPYYDAFTEQRASWNLFTISAFDTPNLDGLDLEELLELDDEALDLAPRPYLVRRRWVREKWDEWGEGNPLWEAKVLGQFPSQSESALLSLSWLEAAKEPVAKRRTGRLTGGIDVAGPGEAETTLFLRDGPDIVHQNAWPHQDPRGEVIAELRPFRDSLDVLNVDSIGQGYYFGKHLEDQGLPVRYVNVAVNDADVVDTELFQNLKAELYWSLRQRAERGELGGLTDARTIAQLASIQYKHNARGQIVIESKEDARKRGVKSPDRAEGVMLAFAPPVVVPPPRPTNFNPSAWRKARPHA